jgi:hypothetical protein
MPSTTYTKPLLRCGLCIYHPVGRHNDSEKKYLAKFSYLRIKKATAMLTKTKLKEAIDKFPENFTIHELIDRLILIEKVERGNLQSENGEIVSEEDLEKEFGKWFE